MKRIMIRSAAILAAIGGTVALAPAANAQATRTWVSGVGDDANPCSRTAPCKTFAGAISKTAAGGEINCLDPGGWGAVTITKAMTIDCSQFPGGILNSGGNGININAGVNDAVVLRGLEVTGVSTSMGSNGINVAQAGSVTLENVTIRYQNQGVRFFPANASRLNLINVSILNTGTSGSGGGILLQPNTGGSVYATLQSVRIIGSQNIGLNVIPGEGNVLANVNDTTVANHGAAGVQLTTTNATRTGMVFVNNTQLVYNGTYGVRLDGNALVIAFANSVITGNGTGISTNGVLFPTVYGVRTYQNNRVGGNSVDGSFTGTIAQQ